jgi:hypothetical protein
LSVRIPESAHQEFDELRALADAKGFDLRGSLTGAVLQWLRQACKELGVSKEHGNGLGYAGESNGAEKHRGERRVRQE